jgi:glycosyltransferase involved in cell wall biosynthesis
MAKLRLGVVNPETWDFFNELFEFFRSRYETSLFTKRETSLPIFRSRLEARRLRRDLGRFLRGHDVVFFEWASDMLALATSLPKSAAIVTRLHRWELYAWADAVDWNAVDRVILVSEAKREEFLKRFPEQESKVTVVPESIDLRRFPFTERHFSGSIGTLCHIRPRKRVYDLVLTFADLLKADPSLRLHIGGNPVPDQMDYYHALRSIVRRLSIEDSVVFDGLVERPWEWYPKIDIFVSNSYSEGLQVSPMEAMASGCYTLSHRWDGADELLPEDCLYGTNGELSEKVLAYCGMSDEAREQVRGRLRRIAAEKFDIEVNKFRIGELVEGLARS